MAEHDYSVSIDKCPRCVELKGLAHDMNAPPSKCRACVEFSRERSRKSRGTHIPGISLDVVYITNAHARLPIAPPQQAKRNDTESVAAVPTSTAQSKASDQVLADAKRAAYAAIAAKRAIAASWAEVISEMNNRNQSPPAGTQ